MLLKTKGQINIMNIQKNVNIVNVRSIGQGHWLWLLILIAPVWCLVYFGRIYQSNPDLPTSSSNFYRFYRENIFARGSFWVKKMVISTLITFR